MKRFTQSHEWITVENGIATIGVTDYAQQELGEIVYVELPDLGSTLKAGQEAAVLESTKAAADVYTPVSGEVVRINELLTGEANLVNRSPERNGWLFCIELSAPQEIEGLLDEAKYKALLR